MLTWKPHIPQNRTKQKACTPLAPVHSFIDITFTICSPFLLFSTHIHSRSHFLAMCPSFESLFHSYCLSSADDSLTHHINITSSLWNLTQFPGLCEFTGHVCALIQRKRISIFSHVSLASQWFCLEVEASIHSKLLIKMDALKLTMCTSVLIRVYTILYMQLCVCTHASYTVHRPTDTHVHAHTKLCTRL